MVVAGLGALTPNPVKVTALAVVTSAEAERDRSRREQWRAVLGIAFASGLVLFATLSTLRMQKRAIELDQQRLLNKLERDRHDCRFANAGVALEYHPSPNDSLLIACESSLFEQAIVDILINALEASKSGQRVSLTIEDGDRYVRFVVLDAGISELAVSRVTDPFFTTESHTGGSGLGLTIAKEILNHHRGSLSFELRQSTEANGSTGTKVVVRLPRLEDVSAAI